MQVQKKNDASSLLTAAIGAVMFGVFIIAVFGGNG